MMEHKPYIKINAGTAVTRKILDNLGSPDDALKIIHIAGTNGKGSTAEFFTQILVAAGKRVGTFTSPAVYDFYDQFRIDGKPLSPEVAERYFERAAAVSDGLNPTDFEIQTAGVLLAFKEEGCEWAVIECGMGGLSDATNAINKKELAVITSLSMEHTEYLGNTIEEICAQKAGIIKDCPVVVSPDQGEGAMKFFENTGAIFPGPCGHTSDCKDNEFLYRGKKFALANPRLFMQCKNTGIAIEGARLLGFSEEAIYVGIKNTAPRGRCEFFEVGGRTYILDGGHNECALEPLRGYLEFYFPYDRVTIIFGCLKDKDIDGCLCTLDGPYVSEIIAVGCLSPRARGLKDTAEACKKYFDNVSTAQSVTDALDKANTKVVAVCGSFTLLKEAKEWIEKKQ